MEQTVVSIRMETNKKMQFENIAEMMGVTVTQLFNIFVNRIIAEKKLPFPLEVPINPWYHKEKETFQKFISKREKFLDKKTKSIEEVAKLVKEMRKGEK